MRRFLQSAVLAGALASAVMGLPGTAAANAPTTPAAANEDCRTWPVCASHDCGFDYDSCITHRSEMNRYYYVGKLVEHMGGWGFYYWGPRQR
jgi:uncharacterized membrane protein